MTWADFLAGLYLQAGLAAADHLPITLTQVPYAQVRSVDQVVNPYGTLELGWTLERKYWQLELAARHISSPVIDLQYGSTFQRGMDTVEMRLRVYPWRSD